MRPKLIVVVCLLALTLGTSACTLTITPPPPAQRSSNGVIFTVEQTEEYRTWLDTQVEDVWLPTDADVAALEAALPSFLRTAEHPWLRPDPPIWERLPDYQRQYLGIIENGEQVIHANLFCDTLGIDWQEEYVLVEDGGDCFFRVKYQVERGEFYDFDVNGEA